MKIYLGIDTGSISTNFALISDKNEILYSLYLRTSGNPIGAVQSGMKQIQKKLKGGKIEGVGTTGSARKLTGVIAGADVIKNEITAHATAGLHFMPDVKTILEIGGQDSKIIILRDGVVVDFAMNSVCAAGCGAFLDTQSSRLNIPIKEFGNLALKSKNNINIAGRCTVFAESDMIHKQQMGTSSEDIVWGLCRALVRNYLNNVAKGKDIKPPILFQGGVSQNIGIKKAFEKHLNQKITVPRYNTVMGALGAALLAKEKSPSKTNFRGWQIGDENIKCTGFECKGCPNQCEIVEAKIANKVIARWGDRCGKWSL